MRRDRAPDSLMNCSKHFPDLIFSLFFLERNFYWPTFLKKESEAYEITSLSVCLSVCLTVCVSP
jgi:hypothetical protein